MPVVMIPILPVSTKSKIQAILHSLSDSFFGHSLLYWDLFKKVFIFKAV